jgi:hypothetical protein
MDEIQFLACITNFHLFHALDMDFYPPGKDTQMFKGCQIFQNRHHKPLEKIGKFFALVGLDPEFEEEYPTLVGEEETPCFDISIFLPDGKHARVTTSDWSGSGGGNDGKVRSAMNCHLLHINTIGKLATSSFVPGRCGTSSCAP